jgi:hypothetical protein
MKFIKTPFIHGGKAERKKIFGGRMHFFEKEFLPYLEPEIWAQYFSYFCSEFSSSIFFSKCTLAGSRAWNSEVIGSFFTKNL